MKKIILFILVGILGFSTGIAKGLPENLITKDTQGTGMETQIRTDQEMRNLFYLLEVNTSDTVDYIESLDEVVSEVFLTDDMVNGKTRYVTLVNLSRPEKDPVDLNVTIFGRLTELFWSLLGHSTITQDPSPLPAISQAPLNAYKEFYQAAKNISGELTARTYVLPTVAIWRNQSYSGIIPTPHGRSKGTESFEFWYSPKETAQMYNTMAEIDHADAKQLWEEYVADDIQSLHSTCPKEYPEEVHAFFVKFAQGGKFAAQDAKELEDFTMELINQTI